MKKDMESLSEITIKANADISQINEAIEKANQLKSLLQEVRELAVSLNVNITFERTEV